jgi:hypothetical protein
MRRHLNRAAPGTYTFYGTYFDYITDLVAPHLTAFHYPNFHI